jgi:phage terminase large subunit GpA-like protein
MRERNEALDCRLYARAAAWIAGADGQTECGNLEQQINAQEFTEPIGAPQIVGVIRRKQQRLGQRVFQSSYLG